MSDRGMEELKRRVEADQAATHKAAQEAYDRVHEQVSICQRCLVLLTTKQL